MSYDSPDAPGRRPRPEQALDRLRPATLRGLRRLLQGLPHRGHPRAGRVRGGRPRAVHRLRRVHPLVPARGGACGHRHLRGPQALQVHGGLAHADPLLPVRQGRGAGPGAAGPSDSRLRRRLRPVGHVRHARERHGRLPFGVPRSLAQDLGDLPRHHPPDPAPLPGHDRQPAPHRDPAGTRRQAAAPAAGGGEGARPRRHRHLPHHSLQRHAAIHPPPGDPGGVVHGRGLLHRRALRSPAPGHQGQRAGGEPPAPSASAGCSGRWRAARSRACATPTR